MTCIQWLAFAVLCLASVRVRAQADPNADARALLASWVAAQNQGQFDAYAELYADKFFGIKRAGERETRFVRATWLKDRERMFTKKMEVAAADPVFRSIAGAAEVEFTQRWSSGRFSDVGPKRMLLVRQGKQLKIAQEEMLRSQVATPPAAAAGTGVHFVLVLKSGTYLVLPEEPVPAAHGRPRSDADVEKFEANLYTTLASVQERDLAPRALRWKNRTLRVDGTCEAKVAGFALVARVVPHFGIVQQWNGDGHYNGTPHAALSEAERSEAAFGLGQPTLVARLDGCKGTYAAETSAPLPLLATEVKDDAELAKQAQAAFVKLPEVLEIQANVQRDHQEHVPPWWQGLIQTRIFKHPRSGQVLISVLADNGDRCAEQASTWALFEVRGKKLAYLDPQGELPAKILSVLDIDADGKLEVLIRGDLRHQYVLLFSDAQKPWLRQEYVYGDCGC